MINYAYRTVSNHSIDGQTPLQQSDLVLQLLVEGYEIVSAAGNDFSVHYILKKNDSLPVVEPSQIPVRPVPNPPTKIPSS